MRIALSLYIVQIFNGVGMAWRSHGSSNADLVQKLKGALQLECTYAKANFIQFYAKFEPVNVRAYILLFV